MPQMPNASIDPLLQTWLSISSSLSIFQNLLEYKRIRDRSASYHHSVTSGLAESTVGILRSFHISIQKNRNRNDLFYFRNPCPIGFAIVALRAGPAVDRQRLCSGLLKHRSDFENIDRIVIPPNSSLHSNRKLHAIDHSP